MKTRRVMSRFSELLAAKARSEGGRRISAHEVHRQTGLARGTIDAYINNTITRFDAPVILTLCDYLDCSPGDLLVIEEVEEPSSELELVPG
jgi:DNA-binding Xre family transcriptional regulator